MEQKTDTNYMKTLAAIHKILKVYDDNGDADMLDTKALNAKELKVSENQFTNIKILLSKLGYIENVDIRE